MSPGRSSCRSPRSIFCRLQAVRHRIKLSPKSSYDPFHWVKHRERCLRRSVDTVREIIRERGDQTNSPDVKPAQQDDPQSHCALSPSPSPSLSTSSSLFQRRTGTGTDENEPDKLLYSNHSGVPARKDGETQGEFKTPPLNTSAARLPLCSLSVFRASDMLPFETYLHPSRRLPT